MPAMSQFKAQLHSILDEIPTNQRLLPKVSAASMLNILGGAEEKSHENLVALTKTFFDDKLDVFLHLYGKVSKPGRKIGHITTTTSGPNEDIEALSSNFIKEIDQIRHERLRQGPSDQIPTNTEPSKEANRMTTASSRDPENPLVVVTMGSDSDLGALVPAFDVLEKFHVPYDFTITSAHRTPERMIDLGKTAAARGVKVLIAAAGGAAHLPGMLASETPLPVIGVPIKASQLDGTDSLLSIVQMPRGCPVATVGINNSTNAALLAIKILATSDGKLLQALQNYMQDMSDEVVSKATKLRRLGYKDYLDRK